MFGSEQFADGNFDRKSWKGYYGTEETEELSRCKKFTLNIQKGRGSNIKYNPHVFTEQGIYMLMTVLRGDLAIKQSRDLVSTFKKMKDYILSKHNHNAFLQRVSACIAENQHTLVVNQI